MNNLLNDRIVELYKRTHIGTALEETLTHLTNTGELNEDMKKEFIKVFCDTFIEFIAEDPQFTCTIEGHLESYRHMDNEWTFYVKEATLASMAGERTEHPMIKIVALNCKYREEEQPTGPKKKRKIKEE